jgi:energy-coupling factor transporter ATP-binding protein EcfA2
LLIAGAAGSGKSTFLKKLLAYLRTEYRELRKKKHPQLKAVVILLVPLGSLVNPMTDLWAEGLKKQYGLTQAQCDELREHVRKGEAEVLFLLDAYDELSASNIGKSLYQANNLEQYRSDDERKANVHSNPVVIYTCRSETLDGVKGGPAEYEKWFLPLAVDNEDLDEETEARPYFSQVRIARVDDKVEDYFAAHAALEARKAFERKYGPIPPSNRDVEPDEKSFEEAFWRRTRLRQTACRGLPRRYSCGSTGKHRRGGGQQAQPNWRRRHGRCHTDAPENARICIQALRELLRERTEPLE